MTTHNKPSYRLALKAFRIQYKFSTESMAEFLGVSEAEYLRIENDKSYISNINGWTDKLYKIFYAIHSFSMTFEMLPSITTMRKRIAEYLQTDNQELISATLRQTYITTMFSKNTKTLKEQ